MHPHDALHEIRRLWLAAVLRGETPPWSDGLGDPLAVLDVAIAEGVVGLVDAAVTPRRDTWPLPSEFRSGVAEAARAEVVSTLLRESECRRILRCLDEHDLQPVLLKGSSLAYWAYAAPHLRPCVDIDLLLRSRADAEQAMAILAGIGYAPFSRMPPGDLVYYELGCSRALGAVQIAADLHWNIGGSPLFADRFRSDELFAAAIPLPALAPSARGLGPVHAYIHNCTHRALQLHQGVGEVLKWHFDLHRLALHFSEADWQQLATLCEKRGLAGACDDAMRASAALFNTVVPKEIADRLARARSAEKLDIARLHSWKYVEYRNFMALPMLRQRMRWLAQRLRPDPVYLDDMYGGRWRGYAGYLRKGLRKFFGGTA